MKAKAYRKFSVHSAPQDRLLQGLVIKRLHTIDFAPLILYLLVCFTFPQDTPRMQVTLIIVTETNCTSVVLTIRA